MKPPARSGFRGAPLVLFVLVLAGWVSGRVVLRDDTAPPPRSTHIARGLQGAAVPAMPVLAAPETLPQPLVQAQWGTRAKATSRGLPLRRPPAQPAAPHTAGIAGDRLAPGQAPGSVQPPSAPLSEASPKLPDPTWDIAAAAASRRWSIDAWGFYRAGSDAAPVSQGRVPIYGASQIGGIAQLRLRTSSGHDPRLYLRAYRAMIARGESEAALGGSVRPLRAVPLRAFAELRYSDAPMGEAWRPSVFLVTEWPPQALPADLTLEAYGQAGWVGGRAATPFADGQISLVREIARVPASGHAPLRLSSGAGVWGGAQEGAARLDVGPTMRVEWSMGRIPARLAIDWRLRAAGDAAPQDGLAATLSTSF